MIRKACLLGFFLLQASACIRRADADNTHVIVLQPFGDFSNTGAQDILQRIRKVCPDVVLRKPMPFPAGSFYRPRNRYRADSLIKFLSRNVGPDSTLVGLSARDISTTKNGVADWGVMGLGYQPGNACVISEFRLRKHGKADQLYKVVLHELGHTQGLPHCPDPTCFMRDAEGKMPLDEETHFCRQCRTFLRGKKWAID